MDAENLSLFFKEDSPDYENPSDANSDNTYNVQLSASDGSNVVSFDASIRVLDLPDGEDVTLSLTNANGGTASGGGTFAEGSEVTVSATPEDGHVFLYWQGDRSSNSNPYSFRVYNDTNLQAVFEKIEVDTNRNYLCNFFPTKETSPIPMAMG